MMNKIWDPSRKNLDQKVELFNTQGKNSSANEASFTGLKSQGIRSFKSLLDSGKRVNFFLGDAASSGPKTGFWAEAIDLGYKSLSSGSQEKLRYKDMRKSSCLPEVFAYCTTCRYNLSDLFTHLQSLNEKYGTNPIINNDVMYTPLKEMNKTDDSPMLNFQKISRRDICESSIREALKSINLDPDSLETSDINETIDTEGGVFFFEYGVFVTWGLSSKLEGVVLDIVRNFENNDQESSISMTEDYHFFYYKNANPTIHNDIITITDTESYFEKLTISYAIAQSVKLSLFEDLMDATIENTKDVPKIMAQTGVVGMPRSTINKKIGSLFITRMNVNLISNILDAPELTWDIPSLEPLYSYVRSYLDIDKRVHVLNKRVNVVSDLLEVINNIQQSNQGGKLEIIVIMLIIVEIIIGVIEILLMTSGVEKK